MHSHGSVCISRASCTKEENITALASVADGVVIAGEPYFKRCCDLAEFMPNLFSPHFAIVNLDPASLHGLYIDNKVCVLLLGVFANSVKYLLFHSKLRTLINRRGSAGLKMHIHAYCWLVLGILTGTVDQTDVVFDVPS